MLVYFIIIFTSFFIYSIIYKLAKKKKPLKRAFLTMLIGLCVLISVDIVGIFTGVYLPISIMSVTVSLCLGIPGVAGMIILCCLF